jgi:protein involved in polysaccharide export with SLBB domain
MNYMTRLLLGAWLLSSAGNPLWVQAESATRTSSRKDTSAAANDPDYKIGPQDVLRIDVWKEADTNPQGTVGLVEINTRRIFVNREVLRAGAFPLLPIPNMTVLQALSSAWDSRNSRGSKGLGVTYERGESK